MGILKLIENIVKDTVKITKPSSTKDNPTEKNPRYV